MRQDRPAGAPLTSDSAITVAAPRASMVSRPPGPPPKRPWDDPAWQKLWLATQRREWSSLAVVPAHRGMLTLEVANVLAQVGWQHRGQPITVFDMSEVNIGYIDTQLARVHAQIAKGERVILALRSIFENPSTAPLAQGVDAAILCVALGETEMKRAEQTIEEIGRDRFIGSVAIHAEGSRPSSVPPPPPKAGK